jgi:hypothetical protein
MNLAHLAPMLRFLCRVLGVPVVVLVVYLGPIPGLLEPGAGCPSLTLMRAALFTWLTAILAVWLWLALTRKKA